MEMTIAEIKNMIEENEWDYTYEKFAIRVQEQEFQLGAINHNSFVWIDGEETDEELDGTCGINVDSQILKKSLSLPYFGKHIALIAATHWSYGEDDGEVILRDAEVLYIIK